MSRPDTKRLPTDRRGWLKSIGIGAFGLSAARSVHARRTDRTQEPTLSLDVLLGHDPLLGSWEELDDYYDIENDLWSDIHPKLIVQGGGRTFITVSAVLQGTEFPYELDDSSVIENAGSREETLHSYPVGQLDGEYLLYAAVIDVENGRFDIETVDFAVR